MFKVNNNELERRHSCHSGVFIDNFEQISHSGSIVDFISSDTMEKYTFFDFSSPKKREFNTVISQTE